MNSWAAVNPNGIKTILPNGIFTFFIEDKLVLSNCAKRLPKNPPHCPILCNWGLDDTIFFDELFANVLRMSQTCVLVNDNLWGELFSSLGSPATFVENLLQYHFLFLILIYKVANQAILCSKCYTESCYINIILK